MVDIKGQDCEVDIDLLNEYFENLKLIPDLSDTLDNLDHELFNNPLILGDNRDCPEKCTYFENKPQNFDLNDSLEFDIKKYIKTEPYLDENVNFTEVLKQDPQSDEKIFSAFIKNEVKDEDCSCIKSEPLSSDSSSSDDENFTTLLERGGPERSKKRSHHRKPYRSRTPVSPEGISNRNLLHSNAGMILEDNSRCFSGCLENWNISSPESGYDTSSVHSPSPPIVDSAFVSFDDKDKKNIKKIYNSLLEIDKHYQNANTQKTSITQEGDTRLNKIEPLESVKGNVTVNLTNRFDFSNSDLNSSFNLQVPNTDEDSDFLNNLFDELCNSPVNQSKKESACCTGNSSSVTTHKSMLSYQPVKPEEKVKKILRKFKEDAKKALKSSKGFNFEKYQVEYEKILRLIKQQEKNDEKIKIIDLDEQEKFKSLNQTNLHAAVIESNVEKVVCIIEVMKLYDLDLFDINNRDAKHKTALDYAIMQNNTNQLLGNTLLINYLEENNAKPAEQCQVN